MTTAATTTHTQHHARQLLPAQPCGVPQELPLHRTNDAQDVHQIRLNDLDADAAAAAPLYPSQKKINQDPPVIP